MPVSVKGSGGGGVTLDAGAAASNTTLTLPNVSGTVLQSGTAVTVAQGGTGATSLTSGGALIGNGTSAVTAVSPTTTGNVLFTTNGTSWSSTAKIVSGTAVASTSGTSIDFTGIPSWAKRVTVMFAGVSTSGTSAILFQLGTSSGPTTSGYVAGGVRFGTSAVAGTSYSAGFGVNIAAAADTYSGAIIITNVNSNTWSAQGTFGCNTSSLAFTSAGQVALAAVLDRVRITTANGTDTFDAGTINILYE